MRFGRANACLRDPISPLHLPSTPLSLLLRGLTLALAWTAGLNERLIMYPGHQLLAATREQTSTNDPRFHTGPDFIA